MNGNITAELMAIAKQLARIAAQIDVETEKQEQQATGKQIKYTSIKLNNKTFKI